MKNSIRIHAGLLADTAGCVRNSKPRVKVDPTHPRVDAPLDDTRTNALAAALYIAQYGYAQAIASPNPAARLDDMCDAVAEAWDDITPKLPKKFAGTNLEFAETMRAAVTDRLWAFTSVEQARTQAPGFGYVFDILVDCLKAGADPATVRADTHRISRQLATEADTQPGQREFTRARIAIDAAVEASADPKGTARALRTYADMTADELTDLAGGNR